MRVFRSRFFWKLVITFSSLFFTIATFIGVAVYNQSRELILSEIKFTLEEVLKPLLDPSQKYLIDPLHSPIKQIVREMEKNSAVRVTLIDASGKVRLDSSISEVKQFDNHSNRPEFKEALEKKWGSSKRYSISLDKSMIYLAKKLEINGSLLGVLRVSVPLSKEEEKLSDISSKIIGVTALGFIFALVSGSILASRVTIPITEMREACAAIRKGRYDKKVKTIPRDEIGILAKTLNRMGDEITHKISQIKDDTARLKQLERVRQDFVANVSHEIKTPLTTIMGYAETLLDGAIDDKENCKRFISKIESASKRLMALVQDIISLSQLESDSQKPQIEPVSWENLIQQILPQFEGLVKKNELKINQKFFDELQVFVYGDKEAMVQIIYNLVSNAIRYTPKGGEITLQVKQEKEEGILQVIDTGIGISKNDLGRVFERFYRVDKARSRELGGTGLGLSIVKHLTSNMNGHIDVESSIGVGSKFSIYLPIARGVRI